MPRRRTSPFAGVIFIQTSRSLTRGRESTKTVINEAKSDEIERRIGAWTDIPYRSGHAPETSGARGALAQNSGDSSRTTLSTSVANSHFKVCKVIKVAIFTD